PGTRLAAARKRVGSERTPYPSPEPSDSPDAADLVANWLDISRAVLNTASSTPPPSATPPALVGSDRRRRRGAPADRPGSVPPSSITGASAPTDARDGGGRARRAPRRRRS